MTANLTSKSVRKKKYLRIGKKIHRVFADITEMRESLDEYAYGERQDLETMYYHLKKARLMADYLIQRMEREGKAPTKDQ